MKTTLTAIALCTSSILFAQVQIDKPIQLTGGSGERVISNLELPVNAGDAANKAYVDAAVAASGGSLSMVSDESLITMTLGDAVRYCNGLTESTHSDWRLPTYEELLTLTSRGGVTVTNNSSTNFVWFAGALASTTSSTNRLLQSTRLSDGAVAIHYYYDGGSAYVRCVR